MNDLISRQDAIKAICEDGTWLEGQGCTDISMAERKQRDADILSDLPSVQPEMIREIRKWINSNNRGHADYFIVDKIEEIINKYE